MYTELDINLLPPGGRNADPAVANPYVKGLPDEKQQALARRYADIFAVFLRHRDALAVRRRQSVTAHCDDSQPRDSMR